MYIGLYCQFINWHEMKYTLKKSRHASHLLHVHLVFTPKCRKKIYGGQKVVLWSRSYFAASVGGAPIEILKQYIEQQDKPN